ncbi:MAG: glyoxalase superfamily protein [Pseudomonadota bacterium]
MRLAKPIPIFRIFDETLARAFYRDYLGFSVVWEHRFDPAAPLYMEIERDGATLHLSEHSEDATPGATARVAVDDLRGFHAELSAKPYRYARPGIVSQPWGVDEMKISDNFSNALIFFQER